MKKSIFLENLEKLDSVDLLNGVGWTILQNPQYFPVTIENADDYLETQKEAGEDILNLLATTSLVGNNWEKTIREWIAEEEEFLIRNLLKN